jgi:hypothetical protein
MCAVIMDGTSRAWFTIGELAGSNAVRPQCEMLAACMSEIDGIGTGIRVVPDDQIHIAAIHGFAGAPRCAGRASRRCQSSR